MGAMSIDVPGTVRRTAWLLLGAAIGLAAIVLAASLAAVLDTVLPVPKPVVLVVCLVPMVLIGLIPGARELEVEAARSMLGASGEVVVPNVMRAEHRWRTLGWVVLHLVGGLLSGLLLLGILPGGIVTVATGVSGSDLTVGPVELPEERGVVVNLLVVAMGLLAVVAALALTHLLGVLAHRLAPAFLGPTPHDRLLVAEARLAAESEHIRLARQLHDGIGHALSIISLQSAAARRRLSTTGGRSSEELDVIEQTAREAADELDAMLGMLREDVLSPEPELDQLGRLFEVYRQAGMSLTTTPVPAVPEIAPLVSQTAYRIVSEALSNAQRHGAAGPVEVRIEHTSVRIGIDVLNPTRRSRPSSGGGRGLAGVRERVHLFGGSVEAGPDGPDRWRLRVTLPTGRPG